jgi:hypothetical protein
MPQRTGSDATERTEVLSVRVSRADAVAIRRVAAKYDMPISDYLRSAALLHMALDGDGHAWAQLKRGVARLSLNVWDRIRVVLTEVERGMRT